MTTYSQRHAVQVTNMVPSGDLVAAHLQALVYVPAYIRKLERRQTASERSIRMKSKYIAELEKEVQWSVIFAVLLLSGGALVCVDDLFSPGSQPRTQS